LTVRQYGAGRLLVWTIDIGPHIAAVAVVWTRSRMDNMVKGLANKPVLG